MFTVKATYHGHTRKHTFSDMNTFPTYDQICHQVSLSVATRLAHRRLNDYTSFIVYFLSPRIFIYQSFSSLPILHNLLVFYSVKRFTTPSITTSVFVNSKTVLGHMLYFDLPSLTRCLPLRMVSISIRLWVAC